MDRGWGAGGVGDHQAGVWTLLRYLPIQEEYMEVFRAYEGEARDRGIGLWETDES